MKGIGTWLAGFLWAAAGCAGTAIVAPIPAGHPADPAAEGSPFSPPANPFDETAAVDEEGEPLPRVPHHRHDGHSP